MYQSGSILIAVFGSKLLTADTLKGRKEYSREIDDTNRLVYTGDAQRDLVIVSCKGHYDD